MRNDATELSSVFLIFKLLIIRIILMILPYNILKKP